METFRRADFYSAVAQIIPVLFLAVVVELRAITPRVLRQRRGWRYVTYVAVCLGGMAEAYALAALYLRKDNPVVQFAVIVGLAVMGLLALATAAIFSLAGVETDQP